MTLGDALPASRWRFPLLTREEIFRDRGKVPRPRKPRRAIPPGSSSQPERSYPFHEHGLCLLHRIGFDTPEDLVAAASHNFGLLGVGREDGPFVALGPVPSRRNQSS